MKLKLVILLLILSGVTSLFAEGDTLSSSFFSGDSLRTYLLYVPDSYDGNEDWPLVINYHGFNQTSADQMHVSQMNTAADSLEFLIAYPQGLVITNPANGQIAPGWNIDDGLSENDDFEFSNQILEHIDISFRIDPSKIYVTGWSMGSNMAFEMSCRYANWIAAVAGVANQMRVQEMMNCNPARPISALIMHGTADPIIPYQGIPGVFDSVYVTASFWADNNGCDPDSTVMELTDLTSTDSSTVTKFSFEGCELDTEVLFYRINGGGHSWPGGGALPGFLGNVNRDIDASLEILSFFDRNVHPQTQRGKVLKQEFVIEDSSRSYLLYVPASYTDTNNWPLVLNYHGFSVDAGSQLMLSQMNRVADTAQFLVAYPQGLLITNPINMFVAPGWNIDDSLSVNDDFAYSNQLVEDIKSSFELDTTRIHVTGWSMGASMAQEMTCRYGEWIASVAAVSNQMRIKEMMNCSPYRARSALILHGTADPIIPFDGIPGVFDSVGATVSFWLDNDTCTADPIVTNLPDVVNSDSSTVSKISYPNCACMTEVLLYRINNGSHQWPGGSDQFPSLGNHNKDIQASAEIWNFFRRNPLPDWTCGAATSIDPELLKQAFAFKLYPNPTADYVSIFFELEKAAEVKLELFDLRGQLLQQTNDMYFRIGEQEFEWKLNQTKLSDGLYYLSVNIEGQRIVEPILFQKID